MLQLNVWSVVLCLMFSCCLFCEGTHKTKKKSLNVLTYNTWLEESRMRPFAGKEARKQRIIKSLKNSKADVICLQEVFFGRDLEDIVNGVKKQYPYSFSELHENINNLPPQAEQNTRPPCNATLVNAYTKCLKTFGCNFTDEQQNAACVFANCLVPAFNIHLNEDQKCLTCISTSLLNIDECSDNGTEVVGGRQVNIGGLVVLAKNKLSNASYTDFHPTTKESLSRGYIKAEVKDYATVMCVHLSVDVEGLFAEPDLLLQGVSSYAEMNTIETKSIINNLEGVERAVLMGDLNMGPTFKSGQIAKLLSNYNMLKEQLKTKPVKTYTFKDPEDDLNTSILDHIFVQGLSMKRPKRVFVPKKKKLPMSDHVGLLSKLTLKR